MDSMHFVLYFCICLFVCFLSYVLIVMNGLALRLKRREKVRTKCAHSGDRENDKQVAQTV